MRVRGVECRRMPNEQSTSDWDIMDTAARVAADPPAPRHGPGASLDCAIASDIREGAHHSTPQLRVPLFILLIGYAGHVVRSVVP
jgi:hypothetical protein